jgi:hypothetical protein
MMAGRLLAWGFDRKKSAASAQEYAQLLDLYYSTPAFKDVVDQMAEGMGLRIVYMRTGDAQARQLVLGTDPDGQFSRAPNPLRVPVPTTTADDRLITALIHLGIAIALYPKESDLDQPLEQRRFGITANDVHATLKKAVKATLEQEPTDDESPVGKEGTLLHPARLYDRLSEASTTRRGNIRKSSAIGRITSLLDSYVSDHLMELVAGKYRPTFYYQAHLQEFAATRVFEIANERTDG